MKLKNFSPIYLIKKEYSTILLYYYKFTLNLQNDISINIPVTKFMLSMEIFSRATVTLTLRIKYYILIEYSKLYWLSHWFVFTFHMLR